MANLSNINGKFVVDTAGNIGVGTLTPRSDANTTNISIQSSGTARLFVNNTGASGKEYAIYSSANGDFGIFDYGAVSARLVINTSGNATFAGNITANTGSKITSSSADTTFSIETTSGTTIFPILDFVSSHSSVGAKIRVSGTDVISLDKSQNATFAGNVTVSGTYLTLGGEGYIRSDDSGYLHFQGGTTGTRFFNNANNTALFTILNNGNATFAGNVGIGITSPQAKLHINPITTDEIAIAINGTQNYSAGQFQRIAAGDASSLNRLAIGFGYDNPTDWSIRYSSYGRHEFYTGNDWGNAANTEKMVITSSGNVGIGTTAPEGRLDVTGNIWLNSDNANAAYYLRINRGQSQDGGILLYGNKVLDWQLVNLVNRDLNWYSYSVGSSVMRLTSAGNLGIGASSPNEKLVIRETSNTAATRIKIEGGSYGFTLGKTNGSANYAHLRPRSNSPVVFRLMPNVGPNTSYMEVWGTDYESNQTNYNRLMFYINGSTGDANIKINKAGSSPAGSLYIGTASSEQAITILNSGNVGIGVTSPSSTLSLQNSQSTAANNTTTGSIFQAASPNSGIFMRNRGNSAGIGGTPYSTQLFTDAAAGNFEIYNNAATFNLVLGTNATERMRITSTGAISVGSSGTAYGAAGEVLTSNGNASPSWQAAGGGGSAWPQEKFAEYTINSTTSNILVATMNSTTWHGNYLSGCLKFTMSTSDYVQVTYVPVSTFLSGSSKWFFKGTEMTSKNNGSNPAQLVFTFAGDLGTFGSTCTLKINRNQSISNYIKVNVLVQAISNPNMFILN